MRTRIGDGFRHQPRHRPRRTVRLLTVGAATALLATVLTVAAASVASAAPTCHPYPDVAASNQHCQNIAWLKKQGITKPADGKYHPAGPVTRGAMAAFLFRVTHPNQASPGCIARPFPDVASTDLFCGYIRWAAENDIAFGYGDGEYKAGNPVTRGAMAAFIYRLANPGIGAKDCTAKPYRDVTKGSQFCGVITWMKVNHVTYGVDKGKDYAVAEPVTRQAMASFLRRATDNTDADAILPIRTITVTGADTGDKHRVTLWASDGVSDCADHAAGRMAKLFTDQPCNGERRSVWTAPFDGRTVALSVLDYASWPGKSEFLSLVEDPDGGTVEGLAQDGRTIPGVAANPATVVRSVSELGKRLVVVDAWYTSGTTKQLDMDLRAYVRDVLPAVATAR